MTHSRDPITLGTWQLLLATCGGVVTGAAYILFVVLPPISRWNADHPGNDWQSSVLWYFYLTAMLVGGLCGAFSGALAIVFASLLRKWRNHLVIECLGIVLGVVMGVVVSYWLLFMHDSHMEPRLLLAVACFIGFLSLCVLTAVFRSKSPLPGKHSNS